MTPPNKPALDCTRWLFLRLLGLIYLVAFASIGVQIVGLIGHHGVLPATDFLYKLNYKFASFGDPAQRYYYVPTLLWLNSSDACLKLLCTGGAVSALLVVAGVATVPALIVCYVLYLSLVTAGQDFLSFQWDYLLLEAGFISIFLAPWQWLEPPIGKRKSPHAPVAIVWILRLLLFKLMFLSGFCKLDSHDPAWSTLTALDYHYETQPLPTPLGWLAGQLPHWFQKISVVGMFFIELAVPFAIFAGRRLRACAAIAIVFLQLLIAATGNYTFFNLLTVALCVMLLDDTFVGKILPGRLRQKFADSPGGNSEGTASDEKEKTGWQPWSKLKLVLFMAVAVALGSLSVGEMLGPELNPIAPINFALSPFGISNRYGLFAVMTTKRDEIIIEGSNDKKTWLAYEFPYKPGDVKRAPPVVAPFQPRLDWQMWFAALGPYEQSPWLGHLMLRLLQGYPDVLTLLSKNPFPNAPPKYIRASLYSYHFTDIPTLLKTGTWWRRDYSGPYFPVATMQGPEPGQSSHW